MGSLLLILRQRQIHYLGEPGGHGEPTPGRLQAPSGSCAGGGAAQLLDDSGGDLAAAGVFLSRHMLSRPAPGERETSGDAHSGVGEWEAQGQRP